TTTLQIFNGGDSTTIPIAGFSASIIAVDSTATTLAIDCGDSSSSCALPSPITITEGPSTFTMSAVYATSTAGLDGTVTLIQDCEITSSTQGASCSVSMAVEVTYEGVSSSTATSTVTSLDGDEIYYQAVTATAGVEKLSAPKATESAGGAAAAAMGMGGVGVGGRRFIWILEPQVHASLWDLDDLCASGLRLIIILLWQFIHFYNSSNR
ncbi:hypothetical protein BO70DRAFT_358072, partial [Aspergillus heteromorphus CBS 117.55]